MIIEKQSEIEILQIGESKDSIGMSLDLDSAQILMQMLSKNLYSDAIGSAIRETVSNSLDSHRRTNCDKPIIVSLKINSEDNYEFSSEDFGTGLDADDIKNIISKYGNSTKRLEANSLGAMGLGFKSPLAYSSSFYFVCRKDGTERKYIMYEGEDTNTIDLLYESSTTECNGVKVIIPVKYQDRVEFYNKIKEQLAYFENVFFDVYVSGETINNEFLISRSQNFQFSELASDSAMHLCLDNVYYSLDFHKLGINIINIPIALRFGLSDGLYPVPSRESIIISSKAKEIILAKISEIANELITKYNTSILSTNDIQEVFKYYQNSSKYVQTGIKSIDVSKLQNFSTIKIAEPVLNNVSLLNLNTLYKNRDYILGEYVLKYKMENNKFRENKNYYYRELQPMSFNKSNYYVYNETIPGNKKTYFREELNSSLYCFVKKTKSFKLKRTSLYSNSYQNYYEILNLNEYPKNQWRQVIKEFQYVQSLLLENFIDVDNFVIPQKWHDDRKKKRVSTANEGERKVKLQGEILCKLGVPLLRYNQGNNCKFVSQTYKLEDLHKQKCLFVYTEHNKASKLDAIFELCNKQKINFVTFSDQSLKIIEKLNIHNLMSYEKFMEGKNAPFKRIVTSHLINELIDKNSSMFRKLNCIKLISESLYKKLNNLYEYKKRNYEFSSNTIITVMVEVAENNHLFDKTIYSEYLEMKALLEKLPFINIIISEMCNYNQEKDKMFPILIDMFKYYKQRIDYKHYNIVLNEPKLEVLTEETIAELV